MAYNLLSTNAIVAIMLQILFILPVTAFGYTLDTTCLTQSPTGNPVVTVDYHGLVSGFDSDGDLSYRRAASTRNYEKHIGSTIGSNTCSDNTTRGEDMESCGFFRNVLIEPFQDTDSGEGVRFAGDRVILTYSNNNIDERKELRFGAFHCIATKKDQTVFTTVVIMSNIGVFQPLSFTITANLEDRVTIQMSPFASTNPDDVKWRHAWENTVLYKEDWDGIINPVIANVGVTDAGVYEAYTDHSAEDLSGYVRLIVRGCRYNLWGFPTCELTCPICYNGGVCDDGSGSCICPPGFAGDQCEKVCPRGFIGRQCDTDCSFVTGETDCRGVEICLSDPFGCTCAPGYTGLDCTSECTPGYYGAGCTQVCHCSGNLCDRRTGECDTGTCISSWGGPMCQVKVLDVYGFGRPAAVNIDSTSGSSYLQAITALPVEDDVLLRIGRELDTQTGDTGSGVSNQEVESNIISGNTGLPDGSLSYTNERGGSVLQLGSSNNDLGSRGIFYAEAISSQRREHIALLRISNQLDTLTVAPNQYTWTVGTSELVTLQVTVSATKQVENLRWRHNGKIIPEASGQDTFTIEKARKADEGVYECSLQNEPDGSQAIMLLKVRSCPSGKWGIYCNNTCPVCYYQGVCHDETGECVCQAGYKGSDCSQACSENSGDKLDLFGQNCTLRCGNQRCRYKQICSPDPIGCHCRAGFGNNIRCDGPCSHPDYGPDCSMEAHCDSSLYDTVTGCDNSGGCQDGYAGPGCQELSEGRECPAGYYGKLCNMQCHCASFTSCDRSTGSCGNDICAEGWGGSDCSDALPYLLNGPVTNITDEEIHVSWESWRVGFDFGTGPVSFYRVNYAQTNITTQARQLVTSTHFSVPVTGYTIELEGLNPLEQYTVSISPVKVIGGVETAGPSSPSSSFTSGCGKPFFSPIIESITSPSEGVLIVLWQITNAPRRWMDCVPSIRVFYEGTGSQEGQLGNFNTSVDEIKIDTSEPCTTYNVSLAVEYENGKIGVRSDSKSALTNSSDPTIKPAKPTTQRLNGTHPVGIFVSWTPIQPEKTNLKCDPSTGFFYIVKWKLSAGEGNIYYSNDISESEMTYNVSGNLLQCSEYEVTVGVKNAAENVGPDSDIALVRTDSDEPTTVPTNVELNRLDGTNPVSLQARWKIEPITVENLKCDPSETDYYFGVYYFPTGDVNSTKFLEVPSNQTVVTITTSLKQCTLYGVFVTVRNVVLREGAQSLPATVRTDSEDPTATPSDLKVDRVPGTTYMRINASWQIEEISQENLKCNPNNTEYNFEVYYRPMGELSNTKTVAVPSTRTTVTIEDNTMRQCTDYEVYVTLKNAVGRESNQSSITTVRTDSEEPTTRVMFNANRLEGIEPVRIQVTWTTEGISKENLKCEPGLGYTIILRYNRLDDTSLGGEKEILEESATSAIISENLNSCTEYNVYVDISNAVGRKSNNMDTVQRVITDSQAITIQPIVSATSVTETSVSFSWELSEEASNQSLKCDYPEHPYEFVIILESHDGNGTVIVIEQSQQTYYFENLTESTSYTIYVMVRNFAGRMGPSGVAAVTTEAVKNSLAIGLGVSLPLLLILVLFLLYFLVLPKTRNKNKSSGNDVGLDFKGYIHDEHAESKEVSVSQKSSDGEQNSCIPVKELPKYVKTKKMSEDGFQEEYNRLIQGNYRQSAVGKNDANKEKNRFKNIITYDHSRVQLPIINNDPHSDYINASYIDGYKLRNAFIASQGPNKASLVDFWRMIWHEGCTKIIMVTNLTEAGKVKCLKYWPDLNTVQTYFDMDVKTIEEKYSNQLVTRHIKITKGEEVQEVTQFHFIGWPDMKVPQSADILWDILDETEKNQTTESPPIVVHCSAGCGRSGTIIALSALREMMRTENKVDVFNFVNDMRKQRTTMVQVCDQYQFIFESLLIYSQVGKTSVNVDEYNATLRSWKTRQNSKALCKLNKQFNIIKYVSPFLKPPGELAGSLAQNLNKNRFPELIPLNRFRPNLMTEVEDEDATNYINASFCDGYKKRDQFISTQLPLSNTIVDFWRMIYDYECLTIVMFESESKESCPVYWPAEGSEEHYGPFVVGTHGEATNNYITKRNFHFSLNGKKFSNTQECRVITQFSLQHSTGFSKSAILSLIEEVQINQRQQEGKRIVVQCFDGIKESSIFMAIYHCCERLRDDGVIDLFTVVRGLRERRPEMIGTMEQYEFCLDTIKERLETSNVYANI
ncbi:Receptor-type tyrosine-protein phosphatase kappa [Holothuria leucospilota]|uniref:protein-tyrosine-phosphatase n=1 Tax=Holothuria leucospilota TaxID=206669 RepID=A0A9Q1C9H0_HOLLE|nr:Receptor-type tyrosine-protein phosphatase kappa [Holothuria leucospilota]